MAKNKQSMFGLILTGVIAILAIALVVGLLLNMDKFSVRAVTNDDITYNTENAVNYDNLANKKISFTFTAKKQISELEISFSIYDEADNKIATKIVAIGNVNANEEKTVEVDWSDVEQSKFELVSRMSPTLNKGSVKKSR